jgi:hypothetical protein
MKRLELGYQDILTMPTAERRFHLGLLLKENHDAQDREAEAPKQKGGKGNRTTTIGGNQLKSKLKSGEINPNN